MQRRATPLPMSPPDASPPDASPPDATVWVPVELDPLLHRRLIEWCRDTAVVLDVPGVARAAVLECLIEQLAADARLAGAVVRRLAEGGRLRG